MNNNICIVLPAYNAAKTLKQTVSDIPKDFASEIILIDDASTDETIKVAKELGLRIYCHKKNLGYGANQKTCYTKAIELGADIVVMVHPDYQYDPKVIPQLVEPIEAGRADAVFGSRMMEGGALEGGMPLWKHQANILLTAFENMVLKASLTEYHSGFRAYSVSALKKINFMRNSNQFVFDSEIIAQLIHNGFKIEEIPIRTRYFDGASTIGLGRSIVYGLGILWLMLRYFLHKKNLFKSRQFSLVGEENSRPV